MTDDRRRKPQGASGWTPRNLGMAALAMAGGMRGIRGRAPSRQRPDRSPRPAQGSAEQRRRLRQQARPARKRSTRGD